MVVLAAACGMAVANIYYSQPLLGRISSTFGVSEGRTELVVTLTQLGYALGLFLLVPLGDLLENRALASRTLLVTAAALLAAGLAPNFGVFLAVSVVVGISSMVAQILIPYAAHLASPADRGKVVGNVMAGPRWPGSCLTSPSRATRSSVSGRSTNCGPTPTARVNTVYMTAIFLGGSVATAISGTIYDGKGWVGVTMLGAGLAFAALCIWAVAALRRPRLTVA
ncbi:MAG TPA: MFS transporter [Trebonia sp.]